MPLRIQSGELVIVQNLLVNFDSRLVWLSNCWFAQLHNLLSTSKESRHRLCSKIQFFGFDDLYQRHLNYFSLAQVKSHPSWQYSNVCRRKHEKVENNFITKDIFYQHVMVNDYCKLLSFNELIPQ